MSKWPKLEIIFANWIGQWRVAWGEGKSIHPEWLERPWLATWALAFIAFYRGNCNGSSSKANCNCNTQLARLLLSPHWPLLTRTPLIESPKPPQEQNQTAWHVPPRFQIPQRMLHWNESPGKILLILATKKWISTKHVRFYRKD